MMSDKFVKFTIYVKYPSNADITDYEDMLSALLETASDTTGLGVDGQFDEMETCYERCFAD